MTRLERPLPPADALHAGACEIVRRLQDRGFIAYLAGGCVRDLLLGRRPKDYDVATNAVPDVLQTLFPVCVLTGKAFGVLRVRRAEAEYEVATFRQDHGYADGRHPDRVTFSDPATDAARRDFTVNALFHDPVRGELLDYVDGLADLEAKRIRAVGDPQRRFEEDHLRMLRAARFAATLAFTIDPATAAAVRAQAAHLARVSPERIRDELVRTLVEAVRPGDALELLDELGLLAVVLPEVTALKGQEQPPEFHPEGDVFRHTVLMLNDLAERTPRVALAALLHDIGKPPTARLVNGRLRFERHAEVGAALARAALERLRFPGDDVEAVGFMIGNHMRFATVREMRRSTLRRLLGAPTFPDELELHRLDCAASHRDLGNYHFLREEAGRFEAEPALPAPWVTGRDVMALGIAQGPEVGRWRQQAYDLQLEGRYANRDELLAWLREAVEARSAECEARSPADKSAPLRIPRSELRTPGGRGSA
jgi:poly(A) polymerase